MILGIIVAGVTLFLIISLDIFHCCFGGLYGEIFLCAKPGFCRFGCAHFIRAIIFLLALFLLFTGF
jgi:hypothetical protein